MSENSGVGLQKFHCIKIMYWGAYCLYDGYSRNTCSHLVRSLGFRKPQITYDLYDAFFWNFNTMTACF
jgi:hypothetical protein